MCLAVQVLQVDSDGMTLVFAHGMAVRDVAAVTYSFLHSMGYGYCATPALLAVLDAAGASLSGPRGGGRGGRCRGGRSRVQQRAAAGSSISVTIKPLTGETYPVTVPADGTVAHILQAIQESQGIPPEQQCLILRARQLSPLDFLEEVGVTAGVTLSMVLCLWGC